MQEPDTRRIDLSLEPLDDFVVVQPSDEESETNLGLILPASAEADCRTGVLTAPKEPRTQQFLQRIIEAGRL